MDSSKGNNSIEENITATKIIYRDHNCAINPIKPTKVGWFSECSTPTSQEVVYLSQIVILLIVMLTSLYNLTTKSGDDSLWTALLTSCLGYILPNPKLKSVKSTDI
jgi:hypothetical protein